MRWPTAKLAELGKVVTGSTPKSSDSTAFGSDIPFVTPGDLDKPNPLMEAERYLTREAASSGRLLPKGAVLISCIGNLGKTAITGTDVVTNQQINAVVFDETKIFSGYGYYACRLLKRTLESMAPATTLPIVSKSKFEALTIPVPPLDEQRRIAAILDQAEELRAKRRAAIALLDQLPQAIFLEMFGDPATNPKDWSWTSLAEVIADGPQNGLYKPSTEYGEGTPILRIDGFYSGRVTDLSALKRVRLSKQEQDLYGLRRDDVVINRVNSREYLGKSALIPVLAEPTVFESNMMRFSLTAQVLPVYAVQMLQSPFIKSQILRACKDAVNQSSINQQDVKAFKFPLPPIDLQHKFAASVEAIQRTKTTHQSALAELDTLFSALQVSCFTGVRE
jgi:type I restriction enzyme S subunit